MIKLKLIFTASIQVLMIIFCIRHCIHWHIQTVVHIANISVLGQFTQICKILTDMPLNWVLISNKWEILYPCVKEQQLMIRDWRDKLSLNQRTIKQISKWIYTIPSCWIKQWLAQWLAECLMFKTNPKVNILSNFVNKGGINTAVTLSCKIQMLAHYSIMDNWLSTSDLANSKLCY